MDLVVLLLVIAIIFGVEKYKRAKATNYDNELRKSQGRPPFDWDKYKNWK